MCIPVHKDVNTDLVGFAFSHRGQYLHLFVPGYALLTLMPDICRLKDGAWQYTSSDFWPPSPLYSCLAKNISIVTERQVSLPPCPPQFPHPVRLDCFLCWFRGATWPPTPFSVRATVITFWVSVNEAESGLRAVSSPAIIVTVLATCPLSHSYHNGTPWVMSLQGPKATTKLAMAINGD